MSSAELLQRLGGVFHDDVLMPMLSAATEKPAEVRDLIAAIREKLDALDVLLDGYGSSTAIETAAPNGRDAPAASRLEMAPGRQDASEPDEIGRNQRSRLREMALLETLSSDARPFSLQQLMRVLEERGFADGSAAIVSQLHRMKKLGIIEQPANGMYEVTQDGLGHLRKLRASFGALARSEGRPQPR